MMLLSDWVKVPILAGVGWLGYKYLSGSQNSKTQNDDRDRNISFIPDSAENVIDWFADNPAYTWPFIGIVPALALEPALDLIDKAEEPVSGAIDTVINSGDDASSWIDDIVTAPTDAITWAYDRFTDVFSWHW